MTVTRQSIVLALLGVLTWPTLAGAQAGQAAEHPAAELPPISFTCPMHPDVIDGEASSCPICQMDLVETRIELAFTCPVHGVIHRHEGGVCPIDGRTLQPVTLELSWSCPDHLAVSLSEPGICPFGGHRPLEVAWKARAHGDHNPKHGGLFFMAPDNWHHLEGSYPEPGVFRVHVYDDFTKPMNATPFTGRVVTDEEFDRDTRTTRELAAYPLTPVAGGEYLEARFEPMDLPVELTVKIEFESGGDEARFDFTFAELTVEPAAALTSSSSVVTAPPAGTIGLVGEVPEAAEDVVLELAIRDLRLRQLIRLGALDQLYIPALEAKDLALALETKGRDLGPADRRAIGLAVKRVVIASWQLDSFGDLGDRQKVEQGYAAFAAAVADIRRVYDIP